MKRSTGLNDEAQMRIRWAVVPTSIGMMLVAATDRGICRLSFDESETDLRRHFPKAELIAGDAALKELVTQVVAVVEAPQVAPDLPLDLAGTAFQEAVWRELRLVPPGATISYAELARRSGKATAVRAVGSACGANPVAVLVPCHRILRSDGSLGGYAYGLERKKALLEREAA